MSTINVSVVETRKAEWLTVIKTLQTRSRELNDELLTIQAQVAQLSGAVQACDVLLAGGESQVEASTLVNNG